MKPVFPTHVGVFPRAVSCTWYRLGLPHARGGVSRSIAANRRIWLSSPRTWGCFHPSWGTDNKYRVFPTHVGVFPIKARSPRFTACLPHARGGVSTKLKGFCKTTASSPRTWGCFSLSFWISSTFRVFPTHVGVFPDDRPCATRWRGLPHARGGVSRPAACQPKCAMSSPRVSQSGRRGRGHCGSSPRTWGCFPIAAVFKSLGPVFPTHVGVFPQCTPLGVKNVCLPHARGGVSAMRQPGPSTYTSSPRTWGCFSEPCDLASSSAVFPTHVGVFLAGSEKALADWRLPHARGGVSTFGLVSGTVQPSSPRTWGCFRLVLCLLVFYAVFPTHVGVFLCGRVM